MSQLTTFQGATPEQIRSEIASNQTLLKVIEQKMGVEQFTEAALSVISNPYVQQCTKESIFGCLLKAAIFGFRVSPELGQCWIVPRSINVGTRENKKWQSVATFQIGYKGWQELVFRSGKVESFDFAIHREKDTFDFVQGSTSSLAHRWSGSDHERGKRVGVWASATLNSGRVVFHYCPISEIERHRLMSDTQKNSEQPTSIWGAHYDIMAMRVPMRYLCTLKLPKTDEIQAAIEADGAVIAVDGKVVQGATAMIQEGEKTDNPDNSELNQSLIDEVEACTTVEALQNVWNSQAKHLAGKAKDKYSAIVKHKKEALLNGN